MWSIECLVNTVHLPNKCIHDLFDEAQDYPEELWNDCEDVADKKTGLLNFNSDHMEHMDYLATHNKAIEILKRYNVEGDICFGSLEGDNADLFWGYRFDGKGEMKELEGRLTWKEKKARVLEGKTVVITGSLSYISRNEAEEKVRNAGGKMAKTVSKNTDLLVVGNDPGSKLQRAKKLGVKTINGKEFLEILGE